MPQQDAEAPKVHEALEVFGVPLVSRDDSSKVVEPSEQAFDLEDPDPGPLARGA